MSLRPLQKAKTVAICFSLVLTFFAALPDVSHAQLFRSRKKKEQEQTAPVYVAPTQLANATISDEALDTLVNQAIDVSSRRILTADVHSPWQIFHGILALRYDFVLKKDGEKVPALNWISDRATWKGEPLFEATEFGGRAHPFTEPYHFEGHPNQFLAILTTSNLPEDYEIITAKGKKITIADLVRNAQMEVKSEGEEITWTLWSLSHYLEPNAYWTNKNGEPWSIARLVQMETANVVTEAACGGTHGLFALSYALRRYKASGQMVRGAWFEADQKIQRYIAETRSLQNSDGTFSSEYYKGPGHSTEFNDRIATTGHMLEWLMVALPAERLNEPWVRSAIAAVANDLVTNRSAPADCGPLYHSLDALVIYRDRTRMNTQRHVRRSVDVRPAQNVEIVPEPAKSEPVVTETEGETSVEIQPMADNKTTTVGEE